MCGMWHRSGVISVSHQLNPMCVFLDERRSNEHLVFHPICRWSCDIVHLHPARTDHVDPNLSFTSMAQSANLLRDCSLLRLSNHIHPNSYVNHTSLFHFHDLTNRRSQGYILSTNRYIILEDMGCSTAIHPSKFAVSLEFGPQIVVAALIFAFACELQ